MTQRQLRAYDEAVALWQSLRAKLEMAHQLVGSQSKEVWKSFWSTQQRFFKLLCVSLKVPFVVEQVRRCLIGRNCPYQLTASCKATCSMVSLKQQHDYEDLARSK